MTSRRTSHSRAPLARLTLLAAVALPAVLAPASSAAALEQRIQNDGADLLGYSAAVQGDTLVLGAPGDRGQTGAVYVYRRTGDVWRRSARLTASDGAPKDALGASVAIDGDTVVVGAQGHDVGQNADQGAVYTFSRTGAAVRTQTAELTASDGKADALLGGSVAVQGDAIAAGAPFDTIDKMSIGQGSVYTFARAGAPARTQTAKLLAADGASGDRFGTALAVDGDTIVVGAPSATIGGHANQGAAYTFARAGGALRTQTAKLTASHGVEGGGLGSAVAIDGDTVIAGAPVDAPGLTAKGAVYTFARSGGASRTETGTLSASDGATGDGLGSSVAIDGAVIVGGALGDTIGTNPFQGSAYTFARIGPAARRQTLKLTEADGAASDEFGSSVAADAGTVAVGAPGRGEAAVYFRAAQTPPSVPTRPTARPVLSHLAVHPRKRRITFMLSQPARVHLRLQRFARGRKVHGSCVKRRRSAARHRRCRRLVPVGHTTVRGEPGRTIVRFGRLSRHRRLNPGRYRLTARSGRSASTRAVTFRTVAR